MAPSIPTDTDLEGLLEAVRTAHGRMCHHQAEAASAAMQMVDSLVRIRDLCSLAE